MLRFDPQQWVTLFFLSFFFNPCITACGLPSLADNSKYVAAFYLFLKPVLKVVYIVNSCLANPDNKSVSH